MSIKFKILKGEIFVKRNFCKIILGLTGVMVLGGLNTININAETAFISGFGEDNDSTTFATRTTSKELQHQYYVWNKSTESRLIGNYQTTYWVYGFSGVGFYQSPRNTISRINSNANFLNGAPIDDGINGTYIYAGEIYYNNVYQTKVSFITTMNSDGRYSYSNDPEIWVME